MQVNPLTREVLVKLVYYGPGLGGKTTSLQCVHRSAPSESRGQIVSLATPVDRTLYFDFLPVRLDPVRGHHVRLQLFTVPGQVYFNATRKLVLTGADGVVFVADSQRERHDANLESVENLTENLGAQGRSLSDLPHVFQYNKRDLDNVLSPLELQKSLNPNGRPYFLTAASKGHGVMKALDGLVQLVLERLEKEGSLGKDPDSEESVELGRADDALEDQIGRASEQIWSDTLERAMEVHDTLPPNASSTSGGMTFATLFAERGGPVREVEQAIASGRHREAVDRIEQLVLGYCSEVSTHAGLEAGQSPSTVALMLGVEGERWLRFRRLVKCSRQKKPIQETDVLEGFALLLDVRLRVMRLRGPA